MLGEKFPGLVIASLGAHRNEKPGGVVSARVLFDGTHGIDVNHRTRVRDQERGPIAAECVKSPRRVSPHLHLQLTLLRLTVKYRLLNRTGICWAARYNQVENC